MATKPENEDINDWLSFAVAEPSTEKKPRENLSTEDLAWIVESWITDKNFNGIRDQLGLHLSFSYLLMLYTDTILIDQSKIYEFLEEHKTKKDLDMRKLFIEKIPLYHLVHGCEIIHVKLDSIRLQLWTLILDKLKHKDFFAYPETLSPSLQKMIIKSNCNIEAEWLDSIDKKMLNEIMSTELTQDEKFYLNHKNRASMCKTLQNIHTLRQVKMSQKLQECRLLIDKSENDPVLKEKLKPYKAQLTKYENAVKSWKQSKPDYDCEGSACQNKVHALTTLANHISNFSNECYDKIKNEQKNRLKDRQKNGESLTFSETLQKWF